MRLFSIGSADDRSPGVEIVLLWLAVAVAFAIIYWPKLDESFGSTDNVMRLVQVRGLLDGNSWYDPHEPRFAPPEGFDTHWSRLIDAGVAGLILLFRLFTSPDLAERLARCIWPLLLSGPAVFAVIAVAARLGGPGAARATLLTALPTLALLSIFRPGEIDHHNAQVALALTIIACAMWCHRSYVAAAAGIAGGGLLSVGLEAAHVLLAVAATFGLLVVRDPAWRRPALAFGLTLGLSTLAGYLVVTPSAFRFAPACDALAINSASAVAIGAAGLAVVAAVAESLTRRARLLGLALFGVLALAAFAAFEPRCLHGPFGLIDRTIFPLWLDRVQEMQGLLSLFHTDGLAALAYVAFPIVAVLSIGLVVWTGMQTPFGWALVAAFAISSLIMFNQVRMLIYVLWLGLPFIGVAAQYLGQRTSRALLVRSAAALLASPAIVTVAVAALTLQPAQSQGQAQWSRDVSTCFRPENYRILAGLPAGLVIGPIDLGPSILAHTSHSVVAAPYHRADRAIRFNEEVMEGPSADAPPRVIDRGVNYVVTCTVYKQQTPSGSFNDALLAGTAGSWLQSIPTPEGELLRIWRVAR